MEIGKKGLFHKIQWISNIIKHGLFWHGIRNNLAKIGLDFMPYYWSKSTLDSLSPPKLKSGYSDLKLSEFGKDEISFIKSAIQGIEEKDMLGYLKNAETCIGLKHNNEVAAYMFIRRKPFYFRKQYFNLGNQDSYLHSMYVFEKYRGNNIAPYLRCQSYALLEKENIINHYSITEFFNRSAIKFQKKFNAKPKVLFLSIILLKKWTMNFKLKQY